MSYRVATVAQTSTLDVSGIPGASIGYVRCAAYSQIHSAGARLYNVGLSKKGADLSGLFFEVRIIES